MIAPAKETNALTTELQPEKTTIHIPITIAKHPIPHWAFGEQLQHERQILEMQYLKAVST